MIVHYLSASRFIHWVEVLGFYLISLVNDEAQQSLIFFRAYAQQNVLGSEVGAVLGAFLPCRSVIRWEGCWGQNDNEIPHIDNRQRKST